MANSQIGCMVDGDCCRLFAQAVDEGFLDALRELFPDSIEDSRPEETDPLVYVNMPSKDFLDGVSAVGDEGPILAKQLGAPVEFTQLAMRSGKGLTKEPSLLFKVSPGLMNSFWTARNSIFPSVSF